jgi:hypothetical protein
MEGKITMKRPRLLICAAAMIAIAIPALYAAQNNSQDKSAPAAGKGSPGQQPVAQATADGQLVFQRNCARCHATPEGFSSRISGTIVRHMRIRANLSERDERALLRFLNP